MNTRKVSIIVNLDSRPGWLEDTTDESQMNRGTRSLDYFTDGLRNKRRFFGSIPTELIAYVDVHEALPTDLLIALQGMLVSGEIDGLAMVKHRETFRGGYDPKWMDRNFMEAICLARGTHVAHFDADSAAFSRDDSVLTGWLDALDQGHHDFISYPSKHSPNAVNDPSYDYRWASTRFFLCKADAVRDLAEIDRCLDSNEHLYGKYGDRFRKNPWLEHVLGLMVDPSNGGNGVWYPPINPRDYQIFCWSDYKKNLFARLQTMTFSEVSELIERHGGVAYPCNVRGCSL